MHTRAEIAVNGARAPLTQKGQTLQAWISSPQHPSSGVRELTVRLPAVTSKRLVILLAPGNGPDTAVLAVVPLDQWEAKRLR